MPGSPAELRHILQVSTLDRGGGAEGIAWQLHHAYRARGLDAWLAVGKRVSDDPHVLRIGDFAPCNPWVSGWRGLQNWSRSNLRRGWRISRLCSFLAEPARFLDTNGGLEDFRYPGARRLLGMTPERPQIVHCHNLHGNYFDLSVLPWLSRQLPVMLTLHDAWLFSGHCAHSFACERWRTGCGDCPDLTIPPAIPHDATAQNWLRKQRIFAQSRLYVTAPSRWLLDRAQASILAPAIVESRVIPNGVNLAVFHPAGRAEARAAFGLPTDSHILLFTANGIRNNVWKDYHLLREAVARVAERVHDRPILFLALGDDAPEEQLGKAVIRFIPFTSDSAQVARYYQAADLYLHAARADTFPTTVLEALACGTPVVATAVGGIPEQIEHEKTGLLTPPADPEAFAGAVERLLLNPSMRQTMGEQAQQQAAERFDLEREVEAYLEWYANLIAYK